jgi:uncharacterized membrane protein
MPAVGLPSPASRRSYIDWLRGAAVLCMILWHVVDSWHVPEMRDTRSFAVIVFFAGWAAPMFLFLAGVSLPMAGLAQLAKGRDRQAAAQALMVRGWQVFLIAHLFRLQSFLLSPNASWNGLLKPDILNILGLGIVMVAFAWKRAVSGPTRVVWLLIPAIVVAGGLTPWAHDWSWPSLLHPRLEGYIRIVNGNAVFSLFPAVSYVFAGAFVGCLLSDSTSRTEGQFHTRSAVVGLALLATVIASAIVPLPVSVQRWTGPGAIVALRIGAILVMMAMLWAALRSRTLPASDPMLVLGRSSLAVYWVHVELAYGNFSFPLHKALSLPWALVGCVLMMLAMYGLGTWWLRRPWGRPLVPPHMVARSMVSASGRGPAR